MNKSHASADNDESLVDLIQVVMDDVHEAFEAIEATDNQYNRRNFVRCVFSGIEGITFFLRQDTLGRLADRPDLYSDAEVALLKEESYRLDENGIAKARPLYSRLEANLKFSVAMFFRGLPNKGIPELSGEGWTAFKEGVRIRHRITHPKSASSLDLGDEEMAKVKTAYVWFTANLMRTIIGSLQLLNEKRDRLEEKRDRLEKEQARLLQDFGPSEQ